MRPITNNISVCLRQGIGNGGNQDSDQWQNKTRSDYATVEQHLHDRRRKTRLGIHWDITSIIFNTRNGDEMFFCRCLHHDKSFSCSISCSLFNRRVRCLILSCFQCIWFLVCPLAVWEQMSNFSSVSYLPSQIMDSYIYLSCVRCAVPAVRIFCSCVIFRMLSVLSIILSSNFETSYFTVVVKTGIASVTSFAKGRAELRQIIRRYSSQTSLW